MQDFDLAVVLLNPEFRQMLIGGLWMTFVVAIGSWCLAMSLAILLLVVRLLPGRVTEWAVGAYDA